MGIKVEILSKILCNECGTNQAIWQVTKKDCPTAYGPKDVDYFMCRRCAIRINKEEENENRIQSSEGCENATVQNNTLGGLV